LGGALGCKDLPEIPEGICGNQVVEAPEDCDGFARDGVPCHPPGGVDGCRLDCSPDANGVAAQCPSGWGCLEGRVCRPATGDFRDPGAAIPGTAWSLLADDFDGDGHSDIVSLERPLALGVTKARIHYFSAGVLVGTYASEKQMISPTASDITRDSRSDIIFSFGSVFVLSGERNRTLLTETYPSYFLGDSPGRALFVAGHDIEGEVPIAVFAKLGSTNGIFVFDQESAFLRQIAELPHGVEDFVAEPVLGDVFENPVTFPCEEIVFGYKDEQEFSVYSLCESGAADETLWREEPYVEVVTLDPPLPIEQSIVLADVDGDGHLDALVGTSEGPYVAYGDGTQFDVARPHTFFAIDGSIAPDDVPLVGKDITQDGVADFVFPYGLALSTFDPMTGRPGYVTTRTRFGVPWTEAQFGDLNADGNLDVVCASNQGLDIDLFSGTGSFEVNSFSISTAGPTKHLLARDLDGDFVDDLVFSEIHDSPSDDDQLSIAFGRTSAGPEPPVVISYLEGVDQIAAFDNDPTSTIANMMVLFSQTTEDGGKEHAIGLMVGSSDRSPASPVELTTFAADGAVLTSTSVAVTVGLLREARQTDALTFALDPTTERFEENNPELWLIQDITGKSHGPEYLGWNLDPRTRPLGGPSDPSEVSIRLAAKDLDGDRLDEVVIVAPSWEEGQCIVNVTGIFSDPPALELRDTVSLEADCFESALELVDLDLDGARDIVLLAGEGADDRRPVVLWNDGRGDFSAENATTIASGGEDARAFATFPAFDGSTTLAVVTEHSVRLARPSGASRTFDEPGPLAPLQHGTGIVATDLNGDGIVDLVVADSGTIFVLYAELAQ
jgi:hypothetical protein